MRLYYNRKSFFVILLVMLQIHSIIIGNHRNYGLVNEKGKSALCRWFGVGLNQASSELNDFPYSNKQNCRPSERIHKETFRQLVQLAVTFFRQICRKCCENKSCRSANSVVGILVLGRLMCVEWTLDNIRRYNVLFEYLSIYSRPYFGTITTNRCDR